MLTSVLSPSTIRVSDAVKGEIEGYIALWGDTDTRDAYETWFDKEKPPELGLDFLPFPLMYEHAQDGDIRIVPVGKIYQVDFDGEGIRFKARLDKASQHFTRLLSEVQRGILKTSSGSAEHLVEFDADGRFVTWLLSEVSLTQYPAEERMPDVVLVRSAAGQRLSFTDASRNVTDEARRGQLSRHKTMNRFYSKSGKALSKAQVRSYIKAGRALYDESGNEVDAMAALAELIAMGETAESLAAMLQEMAAPDDEERSLDDDDTRAEDEDDFDGDDLDEEDQREAIIDGLTALLLGEGRSQRGSSRSRGKGKALRKRKSQRSVVDTLMLQQMRDMRNELDELRAEQHEQESAPPVDNKKPARGLKGTRYITVVDKFRHMSAADMAMGYMLMRTKIPKEVGLPVSEDYLKAMTMKTALDAEAGDKVANSFAVRSTFPNHNGRAVRADEVMQTDLTGFGEEWVYDLQGTQLWENIRNETALLQALSSKGLVEREIPNGFKGEVIQLEGADPEWYVAAQTSDEDAGSGRYTPTFASNKFGTDKKTLTVAKLSVALVYSEELSEDSIINIASESQRKVQVTATEQIEDILINADTTLTANNNINNNDGTPAAAPQRPAYTLLKGIIKQWLGTAYDIDAGNTISETLFLQLLKLLPPRVRANRSRLLFIMDSDTYLSALTMPKVQSIETHDAKTVESGQLPHIWAVDIFQSGFQQLATAAGTISTAAPATNTLGRISLVRPDRMHLRWKRRMRTSTEYISRSDVNEIVGHMRFGFAFQDDTSAVGAFNVKAALT